MRTSRTHFDWIPVETVKKIAKQLPEDNAIESDTLNMEKRPAVKTDQEDWRKLAQRVEQETDPNKMIGLVKQLIATLDEEQLRKSLPPMQAFKSQSGASEA